jgi:hypothetical protein
MSAHVLAVYAAATNGRQRTVPVVGSSQGDARRKGWDSLLSSKTLLESMSAVIASRYSEPGTPRIMFELLRR